MRNTSHSRLGLLAKRFPARDSDLIYMQPFQGAASLAADYQQAAHRLAETFVGSAIDDSILKPYLLLYRHAFELQLKSILIEWQFAKAKMSGSALPELDALERNLQNEHGHKLLGLYKQVIEEFNEVFPREPNAPDGLHRLIEDLHQVDPNGEQFRYRDRDQSEPIAMDFRALHEKLSESFGLLSGMSDYYQEAADMTTEQQPEPT